jgi:small subunit ribosomal protein S6
MRHYETLFIINPEMSDEEIDAVVEKYTGLLSESGAFIGAVDKWGRRRLAYTVKKFNKGFYVLFDYGASPEAVAEMERNFKIDDHVIRFLTVKQGEDYDVEAAKAALEARAAKRAQAAADAAGDDDPNARADFNGDADDEDEDEDNDETNDEYQDYKD